MKNSCLMWKWGGYFFASAKSLLTQRSSSAIIKAYGALAQLGARHIRIVKARGSTPLCSTKNPPNPERIPADFFVPFFNGSNPNL